MIAKSAIITNIEEIETAEKINQQLDLNGSIPDPIEDIVETGFDIEDVSRYVLTGDGRILITFKDRTMQEYIEEDFLLKALRKRFKNEII